MPGNAVTHLPYDLLVADGDVNRDEWAAIVRELLDKHTKGKKATFARLVGVDPKTIEHWLSGAVRVSETSVQQVARAVELSPIDLLIRVGVYSVRQMPPVPTEVIDDEQRAVLDLDIDEESKVWLLQQLEAMRETDEEMIARLRARDRERREQRMRELIAQAQKDS
jgi:transcriptional regulator with XRE-family HTH domain